MSLLIDKEYVTKRTAEHYERLCKQYQPGELGLSRQVIALGDTLVEEINKRLYDRRK